MTRRAHILVALVVLAVTAACLLALQLRPPVTAPATSGGGSAEVRQAKYPLTIVDSDGRTVVLERPAKRVVAQT